MAYKPEFAIGDYVDCAARCSMEYFGKERILCKVDENFSGWVVGMTRKYTGTLDLGGFEDTPSGSFDIQGPSSLIRKSSVLFYKVVRSMMEEPILVLPEDMELSDKVYHLITSDGPTIPMRRGK